MQQWFVPVGSAVLRVDFRISVFRWAQGILLADLDGEDQTALAYTTGTLCSMEHIGSAVDDSLWLFSAFMARG